MVSANNLDREVKGHGNFELRPGSFGRIFNTWERVFVRYDIDDLLCIHYQNGVARQLHQEVAIFDEYLVSSKAQIKWATLPSFRHLRHLYSSWKDFDSGIRMQRYCLVQCSGVHQQVLADQWSVQTIWIARWKGMEILNIGRDLSEESSAPGKGYLWVWYRWSIMYPSSPWRGETAASRDGNFRKYLVSSKVRMCNTPKLPSLWSPSLILKGFWFWEPDARILLCTMFRGPSPGSGRSVVSANNLDRNVKRHGHFEKRPGSFGRVFNTSERACEIWYRLIMMNRWSIMYPLSPWRGETAASKDGNFRRAPCIIQSWNEQHSQVSVIFVTFTHPESILMLGSGCKHDALYNVQYNAQGSISWSVQTIWIARWKGMDILKRGRDLLEESSTPGKGYLWDIISMIYYVSIITLTWLDSSIKRWQFSTSTLYHPKFEWATLPSFRHFRHLHSSWKDFDSGIRMQGYCFVQCSGVRQQVLADQWSVQTIWIARWKGIEKWNIGRHLLEESSTPRKGHVRYDID